MDNYLHSITKNSKISLSAKRNRQNGPGFGGYRAVFARGRLFHAGAVGVEAWSCRSAGKAGWLFCEGVWYFFAECLPLAKIISMAAPHQHTAVYVVGGSVCVGGMRCTCLGFSAVYDPFTSYYSSI